MTAAEVVAALVARGETVATCESLTGGLVAAELTSVPGASAVVVGGLITYTVDLKVRLAGVDPGVVETFGVVSAETAQAMADGARVACGADWAVATTGVAGPDSHGGMPPGTVWIGVRGPDFGGTSLLQAAGDRAEVRASATQAALAALLVALR